GGWHSGDSGNAWQSGLGLKLALAEAVLAVGAGGNIEGDVPEHAAASAMTPASETPVSSRRVTCRFMREFSFSGRDNRLAGVIQQAPRHAPVTIDLDSTTRVRSSA